MDGPTSTGQRMSETVSPRSRLTTAGCKILDLTLEGNDEVEISRGPMKFFGHIANSRLRTEGRRQVNLDKMLTRFKEGTEKLRLIFASCP